jgi:hypothetical protein
VDLSLEINLNMLYLGEEAVLHPVADKLNVNFLGITGFFGLFPETRKNDVSETGSVSVPM